MANYTILGKDVAKYQYQHGQTLRNFPIGRFENRYDELLVEHGVNVWKTNANREGLHTLARQEFPDMVDDGLAIKSYFQLRHLNPSFAYDKANDIAVLAYPVYGTDDYFGIETNAATIKTMLEKEIRLNEMQRQMIRQKNTKLPDGIPAKMVHEAYEYLKMTQHIFETETGVKLENVRDLYQDETSSIARTAEFAENTFSAVAAYRFQYDIHGDVVPDKKAILALDN
jgi:hypothetical protein